MTTLNGANPAIRGSILRRGRIALSFTTGIKESTSRTVEPYFTSYWSFTLLWGSVKLNPILFSFFSTKVLYSFSILPLNV